jgi:hypothetical protein
MTSEFGGFSRSMRLVAAAEDEIRIEKGVPLPDEKVEDPFFGTLNKLRVGGSFLTTPHEAAAFRKRAMRCGCNVAFKTTHESPGRSVRVWMARSTGC